MNLSKTLEMMSNIQKSLLDFIDGEENVEENFQNLQQILSDHKIHDNKYYLISLFHLITKISSNHHRGPFFFERIEKIVKIFKDNIKKYFSNSEIFNIFKSNKRILLFLIEEEIIIVDEYFIKRITTSKYKKAKYPEYFLPEIQLFQNSYQNENDNLIQEINKELPENFYEERKIGENDNIICKLIRKDSISEFITYINKTNYSLNASINPSIYETNSFLIKERNDSVAFGFSQNRDNKLTLIKYAAFFGSIQIFQYLHSNNVKLMPSLWDYAIHGGNPQIIHVLEENNVDPKNKSYKQCLMESIKCHSIDLANYIKNNHLNNDEEYSLDILNQALKYHNFAFINIKSLNHSFICSLCQYDYPFIVDIYLKTRSIDINKTQIFKYDFFSYRVYIKQLIFFIKFINQLF